MSHYETLKAKAMSTEKSSNELQFGYTDVTFRESDTYSAVGNFFRAYKTVRLPAGAIPLSSSVVQRVNVTASVISVITNIGTNGVTVSLDTTKTAPFYSDGSAIVRILYSISATASTSVSSALTSNKLSVTNADLSSLMADFADDGDSERLSAMEEHFMEE